MKRAIFTLVFVLFACIISFSQQWPNVPGKLEILTDSLNRPIGIRNGFVITSDAALNRVFRNNQVYNSFQAYPAAWNQALRDIYVLECNCNERLLKDTLERAPFYYYVEFINQTVLTSYKEETEPADLKIYPIPAASRVFLEAKEKIEKAQIMDLSGKLIYEIENPTKYFDVSGLRSGQYLLLLTSKAKTFKRLILKE
ncbi:T9SS type A sorting domain-containing protein [Adhaeribacter sp. BT258]|uniref:T9SS type A sorting domain-containing protein n=1 Tax=Adhaeribacter terrigena TaxID=2793070 RepID=A0ABS1BX90_9BACT|nr:T9SS type A sorting domain-containing protein [Adhaeribacter terrigena]MBK0401669.1 T9SS type A sorting domain-containing protein [Adhaeribacter terrigena]